MISREAYVSDNPPTSKQLFELASLAVSVARETNHLRRPQGVPAIYSMTDLYWINELSEELYGEDNSVGARRVVSVRIGRKATQDSLVRQWSLRLFDTDFYERPDGEWDGVRSQYRFEWSSDRVSLATKETAFVPSVATGDLYDMLENFRIPSAALLAVSNELREVTTQDCELVHEDIATHYESVRRTAA